MSFLAKVLVAVVPFLISYYYHRYCCCYDKQKDNSKCSESALQLAITLSQQLGASGQIVLLHVVQTTTAAFALTLDSGSGEQSDYDLLATKAAICVSAGMRNVEPVMHKGTAEPAYSIVQEAVARECTCIVMGSHGRGMIAELMLGSVSEGVIKMAKGIPVFSVRGPSPMQNEKFSKLLFAYDGGSDICNKTLQTVAIPLAKVFGAQLKLLFVMDSNKDQIASEYNVEAPRVMALMEEVKHTSGLEADCCQLEIKFGVVDAAVGIVQEAQESGADVIVMGTRGLQGLQRLLDTSVCDAVLRHAHIPVLTLNI